MSKMSIVSAVMLAVALMGGALAQGCTTVLDYARTEPQWSVLVAAIEAVNATAFFSDPTTEATLFAPDNEAFEKLLESTALADTLLDDTDLVARVLSAHLVPGPALDKTDLTKGLVLETEDPRSSLTFIYGLPNPKITIKDTESNTTGGDAGLWTRPAGGGLLCKIIMHSIDSVLVPVDMSIALTIAALNDESV